MPRGDGSGPWGQGPMTGRGAGYCAGYDVPGYANPIAGYGRGMGFGRGFGSGGGFGRGWGRGYAWGAAYPPAPVAGGVPYYGPAAGPTAEAEVAFLEQQAAALRGELEAMDARLTELREAKEDQDE